MYSHVTKRNDAIFTASIILSSYLHTPVGAAVHSQVLYISKSQAPKVNKAISMGERSSCGAAPQRHKPKTATPNIYMDHMYSPSWLFLMLQASYNNSSICYSSLQGIDFLVMIREGFQI